MRTLAVISAYYVSGLKLRIEFSDQTERVVDFEPFLTHRPHQSFQRYQQPENFKKFKIESGNVVWGDNWDVILPVEQLHRGKIEF